MSSNMGFVVIAELVEQKLSHVRRAAQAAGFDQEVRDISGRSCFIRATRELAKRGVIETGAEGLLRDKVTDDGAITFQFSARYLEENGVKYDKKVVLKWDKDTERLTCDAGGATILALAEKLFGEAQHVCQTTDIRNFIDRIVRQDTRRIAVGLSSYFISAQHELLVNKLETFYRELGCGCTVLPVNHSRSKDAIIKHVVGDLKASMEQLTVEIDGLKLDKKLTKKIARRRLKDLNEQLQHYREIATSLNVDLAALLGQAGKSATILLQATMPVDSLISSVQTGASLDKIAAELFIAAEEMPETFTKFVPVMIPEGMENEAPVLIDAKK